MQQKLRECSMHALCALCVLSKSILRQLAVHCSRSSAARQAFDTGDADIPLKLQRVDALFQGNAACLGV